MEVASLHVIRAFSRRQAMDWSLVLASQGIFCKLESRPETNGWLLLVNDDEWLKAKEAIRQFRLENRGWSAQPASREKFQFKFLPAAMWSLLLLFIYYGQWLGENALWRLGVLDSTLVKQGEWWRIFTAIFLHADLLHLISNVSLGLVLFAAAMASYGSLTAWVACYLAAAAANLALVLFRPTPYIALGNSGMVMAALGLLSVSGLEHHHSPLQAQGHLRRALAASILLFVFWGTDPHSDVLTHLLSFVCGAGLGWGLLSRAPGFGLGKPLPRARR